MKPVQLDVRGLPIWDRPAHVLDALARLPQGSSLTVVTENEPRGFAAGLTENRTLAVQAQRVGDREWHLLVSPAPRKGGTPLEGLRNVRAFASLDDAARARLTRGTTVHTARRNHVLVPENTNWDCIGVVLEGVVALATGPECARRRIFYETRAHEVFGAAELFDGGFTMGRTIVVSKIARYARIRNDDVRALMPEFPEVTLRLAETCAQRQRDLVDELCDHATMPILARIARVLARYAVPVRGLAPSEPPLPTMTQSVIAASAGTVKEVAARAIAELEERGALRRDRGHITMVDRQMLLEIAKERE